MQVECKAKCTCSCIIDDLLTCGLLETHRYHKHMTSAVPVIQSTFQQGSRRLRSLPPPRNNAARRASQSSRLLPTAGETISLGLGVTGRLLMTTAAEPSANM